MLGACWSAGGCRSFATLFTELPQVCSVTGDFRAPGVRPCRSERKLAGMAYADRAQPPQRSTSEDAGAERCAERAQIDHRSAEPDAGALVSGWRSPALRGLARTQRGVVTHEQLLGLGLSKAAITRGLASGRLHGLFRGVYTLLPLEALGPLAREQGALLAVGPHAVLSHLSAAVVWGVRPPAASEVHVTVSRDRSGHARAGLRVHRTTKLDPREIRLRQRLRVTVPARLMLDLASSTPADELERMFDEALAMRILRTPEIRKMIERHPGHPGVSKVRAIVEDAGHARTLRSIAEKRFLRLLRRSGLPLPEVNARIAGFEVDFLWRAQRLAIEIDGHDWHSSRRALERDHARDSRLQGLGVMVMRFTGRRLSREPEVVLVQVGVTLAQRAKGGRAGSSAH